MNSASSASVAAFYFEVLLTPASAPVAIATVEIAQGSSASFMEFAQMNDGSLRATRRHAGTS